MVVEGLHGNTEGSRSASSLETPAEDFFFPSPAMQRRAVRNGIAFIKIKSSFFARIVKSH